MERVSSLPCSSNANKPKPQVRLSDQFAEACRFETRAADGATIVRRGGFVARLLEGTTGVAEIADSGLALAMKSPF